MRDLLALRKPDAVVSSQVLGDTRSRVCRSDHQHLRAGNLTGSVIVRAVELRDLMTQTLCDRRRVGLLVGAGGDDDLRRFVRLAGARLDAKCSVHALEPRNQAVVANRKLERLRVGVEIRRDLVLAAKVFWVSGEWQPGEAAIARDGEEVQRVPPSPPGLTDAWVRVENHERDAGPRQIETRGQSSLTSANAAP